MSNAETGLQEWKAHVDLSVQFYDLDPMKIVWHGNYARYFEQARCALLDSIDYNYSQMVESGYSWPVIDMHIRYLQPIKFQQKIRVNARIAEWEHRLRISYLITDLDSGARLTKGTSDQVAVSMDTGLMCLQSPSVFLLKLGIKA